MNIQVPTDQTDRALIVVDIQKPFINERTDYVASNTLKVLESIEYRQYFNVKFHCRKGSIWDRQQGFSLEKSVPADNKLDKRLKELEAIVVEKEFKSAFKGSPCIKTILESGNLKEVHIAGLDTDDCVLATAYEAFDNNFLTCVLEECCQSSTSNALHLSALAILREQKLTNHSCRSDSSFTAV